MVNNVFSKSEHYPISLSEVPVRIPSRLTQDFALVTPKQIETLERARTPPVRGQVVYLGVFSESLA